ncbi:hypothetical protein FQN54_005019 [Arachnomyces sp. PD_36]|nr:hypothetical protein FQN54_005019 [Arachnomyces sp. PD_36]
MGLEDCGSAATAGDREKGLPDDAQPDSYRDNTLARHQSPVIHPPISRLAAYWRKFEQQLVIYHLEARGIQRVEADERIRLSWLSYVQAFLLWVSINLAANNISLGMLGPAVFELSFLDSSLCAVLGAAVGSLAVAWTATWGPVSGNRTMVFGRYAMDCVVGGQILSAVSPDGSMSVAVGIVIVAIISWLVSTFGIHIFHYYERYAFLPQIIVVSILYGVSSAKYDLDTPSVGDSRTVAGNRLSFFSICLSAAITYSGLAGDLFVYYPTTTSLPTLFTLTFLGLTTSFTMAFVVGIGLASGIHTHPEYESAWSIGSGKLMVEGFSPLHKFGSFCSVVVALGLIANTIPPTYSAGIDFQMLGRYAEVVPRIIWNTLVVVIYTVCALVGRGHLSEIFTNFLALMGYWVVIWIAILLEERYMFRRSKDTYIWAAWNDRDKLPHGIAAFVAFVVGWVGAVLSMAQVWYVGPIAGLVGDYGADMGNYVGFTWAALVYPPLRYAELRYSGK